MNGECLSSHISSKAHDQLCIIAVVLARLRQEAQTLRHGQQRQVYALFLTGCCCVAYFIQTSSLALISLVFSRPCFQAPTRIGGVMVSATRLGLGMNFRSDTLSRCFAIRWLSRRWWYCNQRTVSQRRVVPCGCKLTCFLRLYWYPTDAEFATSNGWPSGWQTPNAYVEKVKARLPSTDTPSTDGKRYLDQVYDVVKSLLDKQNYSGITINSNANAKDHVYGHPAYYVGAVSLYQSCGT